MELPARSAQAGKLAPNRFADICRLARGEAYDGQDLVTAQAHDETPQPQQEIGGRSPYAPPPGPLRLSGPVERPGPGALPLRGDLAHIALAPRYLVQNYVCPFPRTIGAADTVLRLHPQEDAEDVALLEAGSAIELLDEVGDWAWICRGPDGPAGFVPRSSLAPLV